MGESNLTADANGKRRSHRWYRRLWVSLSLVILLGIVVFAWPNWRQRQLVAQLRQRGFDVLTVSLLGSEWDQRLPPFARDVFCHNVLIDDRRNAAEDRDFETIAQLFRLCYRGFQEPPDCQILIRSNNVTDRGLESLHGLKNLTSLEIASNNLTDAGLRHLQDLPRLWSLDISGKSITGDGVVHLSGLESLRDFEICDEHVSDSVMPHVGRLTQLKMLVLGRDQITDAGLAHLEPLQSLESLVLADCHITGPGLVHLQKLTQLRELYLHSKSVTDTALVPLGTLTQLTLLNLNGTNISEEGVEMLREKMPTTKIVMFDQE